MGSKHDESVDAGQPALVLMHGETGRRHRPLTREAVTVGRARGCDICLDAPDVSSLHCLITRRGTSLHVRDCGSRSGTHLNGNVIRDANPLRDSDILQVGPFSFRVHLPTALPGARPSREQRIENSRRNLARLALAQRRRLRQLRTGALAQELEQRQADLDRQAAALRDRARDYDQRFERLDQAERELRRDRDAMVEEDLTRRQTQEAELQPDPCPLKTAAGPGAEDRALEKRQQELDAYAQHLVRLRKRNKPLAQQLDQLTRGFQAMQLEQQESMKTREEWTREQAEATARLAQQRAALAQAEASLREQRGGLTRMMAELKQMQEAIRSQQNAEVEALRQENQQLHQLLAERDRERVETAESMAVPDNATTELRSEIDLLRQLLQEKDALLEELRRQPPEPLKPAAPVADIGTYEAELNEFQRQLENDRNKLNAEIEQLRARNEEMDEATREMELELSRERAELARERQRLDRLREEARLELEKVQREAGVRDRLAPVQKLREEITGGSAAQPEDAGLTARLRNLRSKLSDAPA